MLTDILNETNKLPRVLPGASQNPCYQRHISMLQVERLDAAPEGSVFIRGGVWADAGRREGRPQRSSRTSCVSEKWTHTLNMSSNDVRFTEARGNRSSDLDFKGVLRLFRKILKTSVWFRFQRSGLSLVQGDKLTNVHKLKIFPHLPGNETAASESSISH